MSSLKDNSRQKETQNMNIKLLSEAYSKNLAYRLIAPSLEEYACIGDYLDVQSGRISSTTYIINNEKNCHTSAVRQSHDTIVLQSSTNRYFLHKEEWYLKVKVCCPSFAFRKRKVILNGHQTDNIAERSIPFAGANIFPSTIIETFTWESLPNVVTHRSMHNLRAIHSIKQTWSGSVLLDDSASGVQEKCFKVQWGLMGDSYSKDYWQQYIPDSTYAELDDVYSQYHKYQITTGEFYGLDTTLGTGDFRMMGLILIIPMLLIQPQDLTYQSQFCMNRVSVSYKISLGSISGVYAFLTHNIEEAPWTEHPFETGANLAYNIPRVEKAGISSLPGHLNKYIGLYLESSGPVFYTPFAGHTAVDAWETGDGTFRETNKDLLHGPNVLGHNVFSTKQKTPHTTASEISDERGVKVYSSGPGTINFNEYDFNTVSRAYNTGGNWGVPDGWQNWVLGPLHTFPNEFFLRYYMGVAMVPTGQVAYGTTNIEQFFTDALQNLYGPVAGYYSKHFRMRGVDAGYPERLRQPFITPVVSSQPTPAALPECFDGLSASEAHLRFRLTSVLDTDRPDQDKFSTNTDAWFNEGDLIRNDTISYESNCETIECHATLQSQAGNILNEKRDSAAGMRTNFWHSQDTSTGQFDIDPKAKFISIELNSGSKMGWNYYHIYLTRYKKTESEREHPLSFHDYDTIPFNKIFQSMTMKWQTVEGDQQMNWDFDTDPDMSKKLFPGASEWFKAFFPENRELSYQTWLNKPVWVFAPNQNGGIPLRRWEPATTSRIDLTCYLKNDLSAGDFYSLFGSKYTYKQNPKWIPPFQGPDVGSAGNVVKDFWNMPIDFAVNPRCFRANNGHGTQTKAKVGSPATWDIYLNPKAGSREIELHADIIVHDTFEVLYGSVSPPVLQIVSTVGNLCWLTGGVTIDGKNDAGCTFLIKSTAGGPATVHLTGVKNG